MSKPKPQTPATKYFEAIQNAMPVYAGKNHEYLSDSIDNHRKGWSYVLRGFGDGLGDMLNRGETTTKEIKDILGACYSCLYVKNVFTQNGVKLSAKDVIGYVREGVLKVCPSAEI